MDNNGMNNETDKGERNHHKTKARRDKNHQVTSMDSALSLAERTGASAGLCVPELSISSPPDPWIWDRLKTNGELVAVVVAGWWLLFT